MNKVKNIQMVSIFILASLIVTSCHNNCKRYQLSSEGNYVLDTKEGILYIVNATSGVYSTIDIKKDTISFGKGSQ